MFNKKGGAAVEELRGLLTYTIVFLIIVLFFYGCNVSNVQKDKETLEFSKDNIWAIKTLNLFLETQYDKEKSVADIIIESYLNGDYTKLENAAEDYFNNSGLDWRVKVYSKDGHLLHEFGETGANSLIDENPIQSYVKLPIPNSDSQILTVMLWIQERLTENEE